MAPPVRGAGQKTVWGGGRTDSPRRGRRRWAAPLSPRPLAPVVGAPPARAPRRVTRAHEPCPACPPPLSGVAAPLGGPRARVLRGAGLRVRRKLHALRVVRPLPSLSSPRFLSSYLFLPPFFSRPLLCVDDENFTLCEWGAPYLLHFIILFYFRFCFLVFSPSLSFWRSRRPTRAATFVRA